MRYIAPLLLALLVAPAFADSPSVQITAAEWALPRTGETLLSNTDLRKVVQGYLATPGSHLLLRYPGGDEGSLWASELQGWLVGLGVASSAVELLPGSDRADIITLSLVAPEQRAGAQPTPPDSKESAQ